MPITPTNGDLTAGIAGQYSETINPAPDALLSGDTPAVFTTEHDVKAGEDIEALTVVGLDSNGEIVPAEHGVTQAIGVLVYAVDASSGSERGQVYRAGCFNPDALVWPARYDDDAKKKDAFAGAPTPTQIIIREIATLAV